MSTLRRPLLTAPRFLPLAGMVIGAVGGAAYWIGAQFWPASIAVVLSMLAMALLAARSDAPWGAQTGSLGVLGFVFAVLIKYNALMGLSTASLPFAVPPNLALGIIMVAGNAASRALAVSMKPAPYGGLVIALMLGFAPAALIGVPGLSGLVAAILGRIAYGAYVRRNRPAADAGVGTAADAGVGTGAAAGGPDITQQLTEACFYLGALATRAYI
jgi:cobalamin synthase